MAGMEMEMGMERRMGMEMGWVMPGMGNALNVQDHAFTFI